MAASVNKVILIGNLTRDPEVAYLPSGGAVCNISLATSESWKDKTTGERKEQTEFHRVVFYNKTAEVIGEFCKKGSPLYVEGQLTTRKWKDKTTGEDKYTTEIKCNSMQLLGGKPGNDSSRAPAPKPSPAPSGKSDDFDDDIPF